MRILIAEDDLVSRTALQRTLQNWGYDVVATCDGLSAWEVLERDDAPKLAVLDWMMAGIDGVEVCRRVRKLERRDPTYMILLTARDLKENVAEGLDSGANEYIIKPFDYRELRARIRVAERVVSLQRTLSERVDELEAALAQVRQLRGLLPICSYCKKIRDDRNYWQQVDSYLGEHSDVKFSHGCCPDCYQRALEEIESQPAGSRQPVEAPAR